jgi:glycosyltransferase involved in cell wall biosynthesis
MASKTPVVAYSVGGIPEQIVDKETGLLVSPLDIEELQSELKSLLEEPDTMAQMGRNARSCLVESGWTWENHAQTVISHHCDLL